MAAPRYIWKGIHRAVVTFGMTFMLIGVILLTVSENVFILGICFLAAGSLAVLCYLLVMLSTCVKKARRAENEENPTEGNTGQPEVDASQFEAPPYEDVILYGSATVWTVTLGPPSDIEPPPYYSDLARRRGVITDPRLPNPTLLRISSDIHEMKSSGFIPKEIFPEPLTPPPTYNESMPQWDEVFLPSQEES